MSDAYQQYCALFRETRRRSGLSLRVLSRVTGVHFCTIRRLEQGREVGARAYAVLMRWASQQQSVAK